MTSPGERPAGAALPVRALTRRSPEYPEALLALAHPPEALYAIGELELLRLAPERLAAVVGTRDASPYGVRVATALAQALAGAGLGVVSGLARGIDSAAHRSALDAGGQTIAVLGTGADVPYPVGNRALHDAVARAGLVLSEHPPGTPAGPGCFPRRNRIIAALARVTVVVEAPYKSGAINTASQALELGRVVAAVPGPIDSPRSAGANLLIRDGAHLIGTVDDALGLFGLARRRPSAAPVLGSLETAIWDALAAGPAPLDTVSGRAGIPLREALQAVARLELCGILGRTQAGDLERIALG